MTKNKKIITILAIFVLCATLLVGNVLAEEEQTIQSEQTEQAVEIQQNNTLAETGTLKTVDSSAGTIVIETADNIELVLTITNESSIKIGGVLSDISTLANHIGAKVSVEYQENTKNAQVINID